MLLSSEKLGFRWARRREACVIACPGDRGTGNRSDEIFPFAGPIMKKSPVLSEIICLPRFVLSPVRQATIHGIRPRIPLLALVCSTETPGLNHNRFG